MKILLSILPYWDPMIPPMGITTLKSFLQKHGYLVKTVDLIVKKESLEFYNNYFETLKKCIPLEKQGNFNNIGHDVLQCHMMAYQNYKSEEAYIELVKELVLKSYYTAVEEYIIKQLNQIVNDFYHRLREYWLELLAGEQPDVVGVTAYKGTVPASLFVLRLTRERYPYIKTLMGGGTFNETHAPDSPNFRALLDISEAYLDKIIIGQGELLFLKYLQGELPLQQRVYTKADIGDQILDFSQQPLPDFSDLDMEKYPYLAATASASCLYQCSFCVASKVAGKYRVKEPLQTATEMIKLSRQHGHQIFFMTDSLFNPVATALAKEIIKSGVSLYYDVYFRVDEASTDIQNTLLWRRGGMYRVRMGIESGSPRILEQMNKQITPRQIKASLATLAYAGIKTTTYWVIGHPGETEADFQQTLHLLDDLKDDIFQAECNYFLLHYSQQFGEDKWKSHSRLLYPEWAADLLVFEYYSPANGMEPSREETFKRVHRFEAQCRKLGIPNPYSYDQHIKADERWRRLHKNAVPPLLDFMIRGKDINENFAVKTHAYAQNKRRGAGDSDFLFTPGEENHG